VKPRASLDDVENRKFLTIPGLELRPLGRPAYIQSLYRMRYPDLHIYVSILHSHLHFRNKYVLLLIQRSMFAHYVFFLFTRRVVFANKITRSEVERKRQVLYLYSTFLKTAKHSHTP
jgi:hypothetical protein